MAAAQPMFKGKLTDEERANWIRSGATQVVSKTMQAVEKKLDKAIEKLDNLGDEDLAALRAKRLEELKKKQGMMAEWRRKGHGVYQEIGDQADFFHETKTNERVVCHFYRSTTWRCELVDKHLTALAPKHMETRFIKINAEKAPFLCERLNIVVIPTLICTKDNETVDRVEGFDQLGGNDDFPTETLEKRLAYQKIVDYDGDLTDGITNVGQRFKMTQAAKGEAEAQPTPIKKSAIPETAYVADTEDINWDD